MINSLLADKILCDSNLVKIFGPYFKPLNFLRNITKILMIKPMSTIVCQGPLICITVRVLSPFSKVILHQHNSINYENKKTIILLKIISRLNCNLWVTCEDMIKDYKFFKNIKVVSPYFIYKEPTFDKSRKLVNNIIISGRNHYYKRLNKYAEYWVKKNVKNLNLIIITDNLENFPKHSNIQVIMYDKSTYNKIIDNCSFFVSTSYNEGFGLSMIETMMSGCIPISISSKYGSSQILKTSPILLMCDDIFENSFEIILKIIENSSLMEELRVWSIYRAKEIHNYSKKNWTNLFSN